VVEKLLSKNKALSSISSTGKKKKKKGRKKKRRENLFTHHPIKGRITQITISGGGGT
jgi:hypothetical protein